MQDKKRVRNEVIFVRVTPQEKEAIREKMHSLGIKDMNYFMRKSALNGYVIKVSLEDFREYANQIAAVGNNINQIARRINAEYEIYKPDMDEIQEYMKSINESVRQCMKVFMGVGD